MSDEMTDLGTNPLGSRPAVASSQASPGVTEPPPLRAVFMVWPGRTHAQTWIFLWIGVAFLVGSLLPWHGAGGAELFLEDGRSVTKAAYDQAKDLHLVDPGSYALPGKILGVRDPGMGFGAFLVLMCALGAIVTGLTNVWLRRLTLWPALMCWMVAFAVLYFTKAEWVQSGFKEIGTTNGLAQLGESVGAIFGDFGSIIQGKLTPNQQSVLGRFGLGFYVTLLTDIFLVIFIVASIVIGMATSKPADQKPAMGGGARRPSSRR